MAFYYAKINFIGSGQINAQGGPLAFKDPNLADWITLTDPGHSGLDGRFVNTSILGAINELIDGLVEASGIALAASGIATGNANGVTCYSESVDTPQFVHNISHNLNTFNLMFQMFDADPASGPGANNIITCWSPIDANTVQVELDVSASGHFVVIACP